MAGLGFMALLASGAANCCLKAVIGGFIASLLWHTCSRDMSLSNTCTRLTTFHTSTQRVCMRPPVCPHHHPR